MSRLSQCWFAIFMLFYLLFLRQAMAVPSVFYWQQASQQEINVMLNKHPYSDAIIQRLGEFEALTGIKVHYEVTSEETYFEDLNALLSKNKAPDVFMTGSYQLWDYATKGYVQSLDDILRDRHLTNPQYALEDFFEGVLNGDRWDLVPGHPVGTGKLWALPLGFEANVMIYNKRAIEMVGGNIPQTFAELMTTAAKLKGWNGASSYGVAVRGTLSWATIHPGYMTAFSNYGARDFVIRKQRLVSQLDSPKAIAVTQKYTDLIKQSGPEDWQNYTWYQVAKDIGSGKAAIALDADIIGYFQSHDSEAIERDNLGFAPIPVFDNGVSGANEWIWSLAMANGSHRKQAAWLFMQYFTGKEHMMWGATHANVVNPVRKSIWDSPQWQSAIKELTGYEDTFRTIIDNTGIKFTPQPRFFETTTDWAAALQDIVLKGESVKERMQEAADTINQKMLDVEVR